MPGIDPISAGLSLAGTVASLFGSNKQYNLARDQLQQQAVLGQSQVRIADYIQALSKQLMGQGDTMVDPYGGQTYYDPVTKTWHSTLGPVQKQLQGASDAEEMRRALLDQIMARSARGDIERNRGLAAGGERAGLDEIARFKSGIGRVDAGKLASGMRLNRLGAVNAGYDDAERAAQTLQLRTGSTAVGDALTTLARDRVRAQAQIGDPNTEAVQLADNLNSSRLGDLTNSYGVFANRASMAPDVTFSPAPYAATADAKVADLMKYNLGKYDVAQGGSGVAASSIGNAAAGLRAAYNDNPLKSGNMLTTIGGVLGAAGQNKDITASLMKLFGG